MTRVAFVTLGCRVNQADTQELQRHLEAVGCPTVAFDAPADIVIINTCTVTNRADFSDRQLIRRAVRGHPHAKVVVTGCWAQTDPEAVAAIPGVDLVVGTRDRHRIVEWIGELAAGSRSTPEGSFTCAGARPDDSAPPSRTGSRTRAFLKIQDGCQHRCAFCIVPFARGASQSREPEVIRDQVVALVEAGHREVVLTGVDMGHYGSDLLPRTSLAQLVRGLAGIRGLRWLRLSSVLPTYFTPDLIDAVTTAPYVAPHFHVPLQSGSDRILRLMRRPYNVVIYRRVVERLVELKPGLGLGTDIIVGFPGETDEDFAASVDTVAALPFSYLHVFPYSDRQGTEAARRPDRVPAATVTARSRRLRALGLDKGRGFRQRLLGTVEDALVLATRDRGSGRAVGLTGNYVEVAFATADELAGQIRSVKITALHSTRTVGELIA